MIVRELKDILENYEDDMNVVAHDSEGQYLLDVFVQEITIHDEGDYRGNRTQHQYSASEFGQPAVLISIEPLVRRW